MTSTITQNSLQVKVGNTLTFDLSRGNWDLLVPTVSQTEPTQTGATVTFPALRTFPFGSTVFVNHVQAKDINQVVVPVGTVPGVSHIIIANGVEYYVYHVTVS